MNKIYKFAALVSAALMAFASCAPEELSTDQLSDENVTFAAMAPNPVARGGALRIQGSNLDRIVEVRIPGVEPITDIIQVDSLKGRLSEIRVIVPVDGPEVGKVVIVDQDGNEYASHADLTYSEPIIFTEFVAPEVAFPGDVVTIKGDYMNNIRAVKFGSSKTVTEFVEQSRYELKVTVPADAVTGKVILCDVDENNNPDGKVSNLFYSDKDLTIGQPTVDKKDRGVVKAGETIKVTGKYLNMIEAATYKHTAYDKDGNPYDAYESVELALSDDFKSATVVLSATVTDGELLLTSYAGDEFNAGAYQTLVPSDLQHTAEVYKAGNEVVITGKNLDLVTELTIGEAVTTFTYKDKKITATLLGTSKDGKVTVKLANGKTVDAEAEVTLVKPTITAIGNLEFYVPDVTKVEVTGTDLDLVKSATLGGREIEFKYADGKITILPTITSVGGKVAFTLENGVVVESAETVNVLYHSIVVVTEIPAAQHIGEEVVIKGSNMDKIENIFIGAEKVTQYSLRTPEEVRFLMPWLKVGMYEVSFHLFNGDVETQANQIEVQLERDIRTIWNGSVDISWNGGADGGAVAVTNLAYGGFDWTSVKPGTVLTAYFEVLGNDAVVRFGNGNWNAIPTTLSLPGVSGDGNIPVLVGSTYIAVTLTSADLAELQTNNGLVICGTGCKVTSVTLTNEIPQEKVLWEGNVPISWSAEGQVHVPGTGFAGVSAGSKLRLTYSIAKATWAQVQIFYGDWSSKIIFDEYSLDENGNKRDAFVPTDFIGWDDDNDRTATSELVLTQEILDNIHAHIATDTGDGLVLQGQDMTLKCISIF